MRLSNNIQPDPYAQGNFSNLINNGALGGQAPISPNYNQYAGQQLNWTGTPVSSMNSGQNFPQYAHGGSVVQGLAEYLRQSGQGDDSVLAHIHPLEAKELEMKYGSSGVNPITGLPQYGKFFKKAGKFLKNVLPIAGSLAGMILGGPAGAIAGGTVGSMAKGDSDRSKLFSGNLGKSGLKGALTGAAIGLGANALGYGGGNGLSSIMGSAAGSGLGKSLLGSAGSAAAGNSLLGTIGNKIAANPLQSLLLGTIGLGVLKGKEKLPPREPIPMVAPQYTPLQDLIQAREQWRDDQKSKPFVPRELVLKGFNPDVYSAGELPEFEYFENQSPLRSYNHGGRYYEGFDTGQADTRNARVSDGEYVMDSDIVSMIGDGNTNAGAKKLDEFRENIREHKRSAGKKSIPPKTKSLTYYLNKGPR